MYIFLFLLFYSQHSNSLLFLCCSSGVLLQIYNYSHTKDMVSQQSYDSETSRLSDGYSRMLLSLIVFDAFEALLWDSPI